MLQLGYRLPFAQPPPLSNSPISLTAYSRGSVKFSALETEVRSLLGKAVIEVVQDVSTPGFYNRLFVVPKLSGLETSSRRKCSQYVLSENQVLHGNEPLSSSGTSSGGLDGDPRHGRRLLPHSSTSGLQEVSSLCFQGQSLPVPGPLLRPVDSPASVHQDSRPDRSLATPGGSSDLLVPRRLATPFIIKGPLHGGPSQNPKVSSGLRDSDKHGKSSLVPSQRILYLGMTLDSLAFRAFLSP